MAFVWTPVSAGKVAVTTHVNEAKTNVDTLVDNLGVSQYSWTEMPVVLDEQVGQPQIQELQDATDYIDSVNTCSSENAGFDSTVESADDSTVNSTADSSIDNLANISVDLTQNIGVDAGQDTGIDATKDITIYSDQNTVVDSNQHSTNYAGKQNTWYSNNETTENIQLNTSVYIST